jgi:NitT/TauT family transport system permease protein
MHNILRAILPVVGLVLLIVAWDLYVVFFNVPLAVLPRPGAVLAELIDSRAALFSEAKITFLESVYGFLLAFFLGVPVPKVALAPLLLVWLGVGIESKLAIAWLVAFFPIVVDTATGLRITPVEYLDLASSVRANAWQTFWKIRFPAAMPFVVAGSKVAITLAVIGAVIGEFIGSNQGLGNMLLVANAQVNTPLAFAALVALAILGIVLYGAVVLIEMALKPWFGSAH